VEVQYGLGGFFKDWKSLKAHPDGKDSTNQAAEAAKSATLMSNLTTDKQTRKRDTPSKKQRREGRPEMLKIGKFTTYRSENFQTRVLPQDETR